MIRSMLKLNLFLVSNLKNICVRISQTVPLTGIIQEDDDEDVYDDVDIPASEPIDEDIYEELPGLIYTLCHCDDICCPSQNHQITCISLIIRVYFLTIHISLPTN